MSISPVSSPNAVGAQPPSEDQELIKLLEEYVNASECCHNDSTGSTEQQNQDEARLKKAVDELRMYLNDNRDKERTDKTYAKLVKALTDTPSGGHPLFTDLGKEAGFQTNQQVFERDDASNEIQSSTLEAINKFYGI